MKLLSNKDREAAAKATAENFIESSFESNKPALYAMSVRITKSCQQAQDILQNVFIKAWEHRDELRQVTNMDAWWHRVTRNELIDFLRKTAADKRLQKKLWDNLRTSAHCVQETVEAKENDILIKQLVHNFPARRKLVYRLNREAGMNYQQIADKLSISTHTVKNQVSLALRSISRFVSGTLGFFLLNFF